MAIGEKRHGLTLTIAMRQQTQLQHSIISEIKENLSLSMPLIVAWVIYSLGPFAGTAMIAHLGKDALAASVLVGTIWIAGITFCFGMFNSVTVLIAQQRGANNYKAISEIIAQVLFLNVVTWVLLIILMLFVPYLIHWSSPNTEILKYATYYAHSLIFAIPGLISLAIIENFLSGIGKPKISLWIIIIEIPLEILFIYTFVFGKFGIPAFGIAGVGYGLALSFTLTTIVIFIILNYAEFAKPFGFFKNIGKINIIYCKELLKIGVPIGFTYFIELVAFTIATYLISQFQATALASHQIIMQYIGVFINIPFAISQAISVRVGFNVGKQDRIGILYSSYVGIGIGIGAALLIFCILVLSPHYLLSIDLNTSKLQNQDIVTLTTSLFFILGIYQIFDSIRILEAGALRGLKDTKTALYVSIVCFFIIGTFTAYLFGIKLNGNVQGIWWGLAVGTALGALALFWRLLKTIQTMDLTAILKIE